MFSLFSIKGTFFTQPESGIILVISSSWLYYTEEYTKYSFIV